MTAFTAETFQNEYVPLGATEVDAIVTVRAGTAVAGAPLPTGPRPTGPWPPPSVTAVVIVIDTSGSMSTPRSRLREAKRAARGAVLALDDGVLFAVLSGASHAEVVYPPTPTLVPASTGTRRAAASAIGALAAGGGTAMSSWLIAARQLLVPYDGAVRQVILLTDGRNESEHRETLDATLRWCEGTFQCHCRGVGVDWSVEELRAISTALLGSVDIVSRPEDLAADFTRIVRGAMALRTPDVSLRVRVPRGATLRYVKQVSPSIVDLTGRGSQLDDRTTVLATGAWGDEERDFHVSVGVPAHDVDDELLAARVEVVVADEVVASTAIRAVWTDDAATSTIIEPRVAHYTGQEELASAIRDGLAARALGDAAAAGRYLGRAAQLAHASGHDGTLRLLARVVDVDDAATGTVRLRRDVAAEDEMALDTRSTATVRVRVGTDG